MEYEFKEVKLLEAEYHIALDNIIGFIEGMDTCEDSIGKKMYQLGEHQRKLSYIAKDCSRCFEVNPIEGYTILNKTMLDIINTISSYSSFYYMSKELNEDSPTNNELKLLIQIIKKQHGIGQSWMAVNGTKQR